MVLAGASGGPVREYMVVEFGIVAVGGGGCLTKKAGTMTNRTIDAGTRAASRKGFRQTKVRMATNDRVCDGVRQVSSRSIRF